MLRAINFPKSVTPVQDKLKETKLHSRKALLFNKNDVWVRKDNPDFDVTFGSYDGVKVCELVGLYIVDSLTKEYGHDKIGFYRADGLGCFQNLSGPQSEKFKKKLCKIFKQSGLSITVEYNLKSTDFLDVTFDLGIDKYYPYRKDNNQLLYINKQSNHPPTLNKQIPSMVSVNVKTNIGRIFLRLIDKHFPRHHKYHNLFNRINIKIRYSCVANMANVIRTHNTSLLKDPTSTDIKECICLQKVEC